MNGNKEDKKHSIFHFMMAGTLCNEEDFDVWFFSNGSEWVDFFPLPSNTDSILSILWILQH